MTCLHLAAQTGRLDVVRYLVETHRIDVNIRVCTVMFCVKCLLPILMLSIVLFVQKIIWSRRNDFLRTDVGSAVLLDTELLSCVTL